METERCPNCNSLMNAGEDEWCPECQHYNSPDCDCQACDESRENAAEQAELRMEVDDGRK
jgi:hypothetical protein